MIIQFNVWQCEVCGKVETTSEETSPYSDPVVLPPKGELWGYIMIDNKELLACSECYKNSDNQVEVIRGTL